MAITNLLDIAKINGSDAVVGLIEESVQSNPEVMGSARTIRGTMYKTLIRTALPVVGFRSANEGSTPVKSTWLNKIVETFIMQPPIKMDKAVADAHEDGAEAILALEASGVMEGALRALGEQFFYGTGVDVNTARSLVAGTTYLKGFPGLEQTVDPAMVVNAGGTGGATSSAWAVKWGPKNVQWVYGLNGTLSMMDFIEAVLPDESDATKYLMQYYSELLLYPGLQVVNKNSMAQIKGLDASGNKLTDDDLATLLNKFPTGITPDAIYLHKDQLEYLRQGRTATNATGAPAPTPTDYQGVPLIVTDGISTAETRA